MFIIHFGTGTEEDYETINNYINQTIKSLSTQNISLKKPVLDIFPGYSFGYLQFDSN